MNSVNRSLALVILGGVVGGLLLAGSAAAFVPLGAKWHDPALPVPWRMNTNQNEPTVPGDEEFTDVRQSFTNWDVLGANRLAFLEGAPVTTPTPCAFTDDGQNVVSFRDCGLQCTGNCIGVTRTSIDVGADYGQGGVAHLRMIDTDIVFGRQWSWTTLPRAVMGQCAGQMIVQSIATHEIGHMLGLGHTPIFGATMFASTTTCDQGPASLHPDDIAGCVALYDNTLQEYQIGTHNVNLVRCGVHNAGNVGLPGGAALGNFGLFGETGIGGGTGFRFPAAGVNHMFEGSFLICRDAPADTQVSDDFRIQGPGVTFQQDADFVPLSNLTLMTPGPLADQQSSAQFDDSAANRATAPGGPPSITTPLGIRVQVETYAWSAAPDDKYVIHLYRMTNTTGSPITNLLAGQIFDWDFNGASFSTNSVSYDAPNKLGIVSDPTTPNRIGVRVLSGPTRSFRALTCSGAGADNFTNTTKADWMKSGFTQTALNTRDIGMLIAAGPFNIPSGGTAVAAFALCAGTSQPDLVASSVAAQFKFDTILSGPNAVEDWDGAGTVGPVYSLKQNAPNPFNPSTRIGFSLPADGPVTLKVFNITGQLVRTLVDESRPGGAYEVAWDGRDDAGIAVSSGTYFYELRAEGRLIQSRKMQLLK